MESNLSVRSNLMLDDKAHQPQYRHLPGDFAAQVYRELGYCNPMVIDKYFTPRQLVEYRQYLPCIRCRRPCAGTCGG